MKKLFLILTSFMLFAACSSDDDSNSNKLGTPVLLTPSNNTTVSVSEFNPYREFVWAEVANAKQYLVQISETSNFSTILDEATAVVDEDDPDYNNRIYFDLYDSTQHQSTYYWRVRAFAPDYDPSDYSATFSFVVNKE